MSIRSRNKWIWTFYRILKISTSQTWKNICVVNLKTKWWRKGTRDLIINLPIYKWWTLEIYDSKTQQPLWKHTILNVKEGKKTIMEKIKLVAHF